MIDRNLAEILTIKDAETNWELFFGRFFSSEIPDGVDVTFDENLQQFTPREDPQTKYLPPFASHRMQHSDDFDDFLNGNTVIIPEHIRLNIQDLAKVQQAIANGNFEDESLQTEEHPFYALWLFKQNKITRQQLSTILARAQIPTEYPITHTFRILDDNGEFTTAAENLLLPSIKQNTYGEKFNKWHLERLRLLMQAAPKSEQTFYISQNNPNIVTNLDLTHKIGNFLHRYNAWYKIEYNQNIYDLHMSFGLIEALQITKYGVHGAAASRTILGTVGIDAVKEGVEFHYRPTMISLNSKLEYAPLVEGYDDASWPAATGHDLYHAKVHNSIRSEFHMMLNHMCHVIRIHTKINWSKTTWQLIDREFNFYIHKKMNLDTPDMGAEYFVNLIHPNNRDFAFLFNDYSARILSDSGFAIVWNMVNQSDVWRKIYKINIDNIGSPYTSLVREMKTFMKKVGKEHEHSELLALKYRMFRISSSTDFPKICKLIDSIKNQLLNDRTLSFAKYSLQSVKNLVALKFKNNEKEILVDESTVEQLIPVFINMQLTAQFGEKNDREINNELQKITPKFKSNYEANGFSQEILDDSMKACSSITTKLDFLEACYEEIIHSQNYKRRNVKLDSIFAFFKNPLTTSQRQHIELLKNNFNDLIAQHEDNNHLQREDKIQLQWYLQTRGSNLLLCNTDRFYFHCDSSIPTSRS